jgi:hypothetical protein
MFCPVSLLRHSLRVDLADAYGDGTVWFALEDSKGHYAVVCIDGREGSPTQYRMFDRARHPRKPGAVLLELGSSEEGIIIPLVSKWLDSAPPRELGLTEYGRELIRDTLLRFGEPAGKRKAGAEKGM